MLFNQVKVGVVYQFNIIILYYQNIIDLTEEINNYEDNSFLKSLMSFLMLTLH